MKHPAHVRSLLLVPHVLKLRSDIRYYSDNIFLTIVYDPTDIGTHTVLPVFYLTSKC